MAVKKEELTLFEQLRRETKVPEPLAVTEDITLDCPSKAQLDASQRPELTEEQSNRILLGEENYEKLQELFGPEAPHLWAEFNKKYIAHFFPQSA